MNTNLRSLGMIGTVLAASLFAACTKEEAPPEQPVIEDTSADAVTGTDIAQGFRRYGVEKGVVEFERTGSQTGSEKISFDQWGMREAKEEKAELDIGGQTQSLERLTILDGEWVTSIDMAAKTGMRIKNVLLQQFADQYNTTDFTEVTKAMMEGMGGTITGTDTVAGQECDVWEIPGIGSTVCLWEGIPLMTKVSLQGTEIISTATKIDTDASITDAMFKVPDDVTVEEQAS